MSVSWIGGSNFVGCVGWSRIVGCVVWSRSVLCSGVCNQVGAAGWSSPVGCVGQGSQVGWVSRGSLVSIIGGGRMAATLSPVWLLRDFQISLVRLAVKPSRPEEFAKGRVATGDKYIAWGIQVGFGCHAIVVMGGVDLTSNWYSGVGSLRWISWLCWLEATCHRSNHSSLELPVNATHFKGSATGKNLEEKQPASRHVVKVVFTAIIK